MGKTKSDLGRIRREGNIPAVLYRREGKGSEPITVNGAEFAALLRALPKGCLASKVLEVEHEGKKLLALVKDISYHRVTYDIEHVDLMEVTKEDQVNVYIPVVCRGEEACAGVTQGGQLKIVKRALKTSVKVAELPEAFVVDVTNVSLGGSVRIRDLSLAPSMKVAIHRDQVLVVVNK